MVSFESQLCLRMPFTVDPPDFCRCMKIQHLSVIASGFSKAGVAFTPAGRLPPGLWRARIIPPSSTRSATIFEAEGGGLVECMLVWWYLRLGSGQAR